MTIINIVNSFVRDAFRGNRRWRNEQDVILSEDFERVKNNRTV